MDRLRVSREGADLLATCHIPNPDGVVPAAGSNVPAVGGKGDGPDFVIMPLEARVGLESAIAHGPPRAARPTLDTGHFELGFQVPHPDAAVLARLVSPPCRPATANRENRIPSAGRESHRGQTVLEALQVFDFGPAPGVPQAHG